MIAFGSRAFWFLGMQRIISNIILNGGGLEECDNRISCKESHENNTLPRVIVGFGPLVTYSCRCKGMDVYHTLNIRTCWINCSMGTESCIVNFQVSTSLINHFSYYIDFHLEKSERHWIGTHVSKLACVPQVKAWVGMASFFVKGHIVNIVGLYSNYSTLLL